MVAKSKKQKTGNVKPDDPHFRDQIIDHALALAEEVGWNHSALGPLADYMNVEVNDIRRCFSDANAIANAWFERAETAMLAPVPDDFQDQPVAERIEFLMLRWFDYLAPHRRIAADILAEKTHPPHIHHWVPAIFDLSRIMQLLRDAALLHAGGRRQQLEEIGLTLLFLSVLRNWCRDESDGQDQTRRLLKRRLQSIDRKILRVYQTLGI